MNFDSKLFDRIRIRRRERAPQPAAPRAQCAWAGCDLPGTHKAPRGHGSDGHFMFCLEHVRQYNKAFNYFAEMSPKDIEDYILRNGASSSARPEWDSRADRNAADRPGTERRPRDWSGKRIHDPFHVFARSARAQARNPFRENERRMIEADRMALEMLGLDGRPDRGQIKSAYKTMVKKHHPDANGGDRGSEERLRNIIAAYAHLKAKGFV
jgi:DnaJ domain